MAGQVNELTDDALRKEYVELMKNALKMNDGERGYHGARDTLLKGTDYSKAVVEEMDKRKVRGIAHEDGRFDYCCGMSYCRCMD